jgi:hypothetical protein
MQVNVTWPFSTSTTRIWMISQIGGGGKCPSMTPRQYARPDIDATAAVVVIGSRQVTNRDCSVPQTIEVVIRCPSETDRFTYVAPT